MCVVLFLAKIEVLHIFAEVSGVVTESEGNRAAVFCQGKCRGGPVGKTMSHQHSRL